MSDAASRADAQSGGFEETAEGRVHRLPIRIYYEDTDAGGIVYHANYLRYAERARTEMLRCLGYDQVALLAEPGIGFAVRSCTADFVAAARLDDRLEVVTRLHAVGGATLEAEQRVERNGQLLVRLMIRLACIGGAGGGVVRAARMPAALRAALQSLSHPTSAIFIMTLLAS